MVISFTILAQIYIIQSKKTYLVLEKLPISFMESFWLIHNEIHIRYLIE